MSNIDPIPTLKQHAAEALVRMIDGSTTRKPAALIRVERERVAELRRGKLDRFSLERLIRFLVRAGASVELRVTPSHEGFLARRDR